MKTKKIVRKMKELLNADRRALLAKSDSLDEVLEKLDAKAERFREELKGEDGEERRQEIQRKLRVLEAQRKKGLALKKEIEEQRAAD